MRNARWLWLALMVVGLAFVGCEEKKEDSGGEESTESGGEGGGEGGEAGGEGGEGDEGGGAADLAFEDVTWELEGFEIKGKKPKGWEEQEMGSGRIYNSGGWPGAKLWVSVTCEGACGAKNMAKNIAGAAESQKEMHTKSYDAVEIVEDEATDGGHQFQLKMTKRGDELANYTRFYYQDGWSESVKCMYQADEPELVAHLDAMKDVCDSLEVTPPPAE